METLTHVNKPFKLLLYTLEHINSFLQAQGMQKLEMDYFFYFGMQMFFCSYI